MAFTHLYVCSLLMCFYMVHSLALFGPPGMPKRKLGELSEPLVESAAATEPAASEQSEGAASSSGAEAASWSLTELNDEVLLQILCLA